MIAQAWTSVASGVGVAHLAVVLACPKPRRDALGGRHIMRAEALGIDELGLVDDPVDCLVGRGRSRRKETSARPPVERIGGAASGRNMVADLRRHVAHQLLEHRLLAVEISVEGAERDARAARDPDDRSVGEALLAELLERGIEDLAQGSLAARGARRLAVACRAVLHVGRAR